MELKKDVRNELFKRRELVLEIESEKNPGFQEAKKKVSEIVGKPEENIDVYRIKGSFGKHRFFVSAKVYDTKEDLESMKKLEITRKQRRESSTGGVEQKSEEKSERS